jgi:hypothetical protein
MPRRGRWIEDDCPWSCEECKRKERLRDRIADIEPVYRDVFPDFKGEVVRLDCWYKDDSQDEPVHIWVEDTGFSATKNDPAPTITLDVSAHVNTKRHYHEVEQTITFSPFRADQDDDAITLWLDPSLQREHYEGGFYSIARVQLTVVALADVEVRYEMKYQCPECGTLGDAIARSRSADGDRWLCSGCDARPLLSETSQAIAPLPPEIEELVKAELIFHKG